MLALDLGQFIGTGYDYLGEAREYPSRGFLTGMVDLANTIKGRGYFRKALWTKEPMVYVGAYPARYRGRLSSDAPPRWNFDDNEWKIRFPFDKPHLSLRNPQFQ